MIYISEKVGDIPKLMILERPKLQEYSLVEGLSLIELQLVHAAYNSGNPNGMSNEIKKIITIAVV